MDIIVYIELILIIIFFIVIFKIIHPINYPRDITYFEMKYGWDKSKNRRR